jgi:hypothetical protein
MRSHNPLLTHYARGASLPKAHFSKSIAIRDRLYLDSESGRRVEESEDPNWNADIAIFVLEGRTG